MSQCVGWNILAFLRFGFLLLFYRKKYNSPLKAKSHLNGVRTSAFYDEKGATKVSTVAPS